MSTETAVRIQARLERPVAVAAWPGPKRPRSARDGFEHLYRANVDTVIGYFARRCSAPQTVADLTSETFVRAIDGFAGFNPEKGSARVYVLGIATQVLAHHRDGADALEQPSDRRLLDEDETEELAQRIAAKRLNPWEGAAILGVSRVAFHQQLARARARLRKDQRS